MPRTINHVSNLVIFRLFITLHYSKSIYMLRYSKNQRNYSSIVKGMCFGLVPPSTTDCQCGIRQLVLVQCHSLYLVQIKCGVGGSLQQWHSSENTWGSVQQIPYRYYCSIHVFFCALKSKSLKINRSVEKKNTELNWQQHAML